MSYDVRSRPDDFARDENFGFEVLFGNIGFSNPDNGNRDVEGFVFVIEEVGDLLLQMILLEAEARGPRALRSIEQRAANRRFFTRDERPDVTSST